MDIDSLNEKDVIEAALFLFDRPISPKELSELVSKSERDIERYIEELRDEHLDLNTAYHIINIEDGFQLKLRDEVAANLHWPFIKRSEVPRHLLKILSLIAFKEYVLEKKTTPGKLQQLFGKQALQDLDELQAMGLINITLEGKKREIRITEDFLTLFKLPDDPVQTKVAIQMGLRNYALRQLQMTD